MSGKRNPRRAFERFVHAFFDPWTYEMWHEGFDVQSLSGLSTEEQRLAEDLLLSHCREEGTDVRIIIGLGQLRSQRAIPALTKYVQLWRGERRVIEPAVALWNIARSPQAVTALIEVALGCSDFMGRLDAAIGLGDCRCEQAAQALEQVLTDEAYLVRYHATNALLMICGLWLHRKRGHKLAVSIMSDDAGKREAALARILALVKRRSLPLCEEMGEAE